MLNSIRVFALIAMSIPSGAMAESKPLRSRIMMTDAPVIMTGRALGNWRREKRIWEENLYPIGKWGQLQDWMEDLDD